MRGKKPEIKKNRCTQSNCGKMSDVTYSASTQAPSAQWVEILSKGRAGIILVRAPAVHPRGVSFCTRGFGQFHL